MNCQLDAPGINRDKLRALAKMILDNAHLSRTARMAQASGMSANEIMAGTITEAFIEATNLENIITTIRSLINVPSGRIDFNLALEEVRIALVAANL